MIQNFHKIHSARSAFLFFFILCLAPMLYGMHTETNVLHQSKNSQLYDAIKKNDNETAQHILSDKENTIVDSIITATDKDQRTMVWWACYHNNIFILKKLFEYNLLSILHVPDRYKQTPLWLACFHNNTEMAKLLIQGSKKTLLDTYDTVHNMTPLWLAYKHNNVRLAQLLIDNGAYISLEKTDKTGMTLAWHACKNDNPELLELFIDAMHRVGNSDLIAHYMCAPYKSQSPLWVSCFNGNERLVSLLLNNGGASSMFKQDTLFYKTPIMLASSSKNGQALIDVLLSKVTDDTLMELLYCGDSQNRNTLWYARKYKQHRLIDYLRAAKQRFYQKQHKEQTQAHTVRIMAKTAVKLLNTSNLKQHTPLIIACAANNHAEVADLLSSGADDTIQLRDENDHNALWHALHNYHPEEQTYGKFGLLSDKPECAIVRLLLAHGSPFLRLPDHLKNNIVPEHLKDNGEVKKIQKLIAQFDDMCRDNKFVTLHDITALLDLPDSMSEYAIMLALRSLKTDDITFYRLIKDAPTQSVIKSSAERYGYHRNNDLK